MTNNMIVNWAPAVHHNLLESVSLEIGGHGDKRWYCQKCGECFGQSKPESGVCGGPLYIFNTQQTLEKYGLEEADYANYESLEEYLEEDMEPVYDQVVCDGTEFEYTAVRGQIVDKMDGTFLDTWSQLAVGVENRTP